MESSGQVSGSGDAAPLFLFTLPIKGCVGPVSPSLQPGLLDHRESGRMTARKLSHPGLRKPAAPRAVRRSWRGTESHAILRGDHVGAPSCKRTLYAHTAPQLMLHPAQTADLRVSRTKSYCYWPLGLGEVGYAAWRTGTEETVGAHQCQDHRADPGSIMPAVWPGADCLLSLSLTVLICRMRIMTL